MRNTNLELIDAQDQFEKLTETVAKANALTQVILTISTDNLELVPTRSLYDFLWLLNDLTDQASDLCHGLRVKKVLSSHV
jgi:hypothetical protein